MNENAIHHKTYWTTWLALLCLTLAMIVVGSAPMPAGAVLGLVLTGLTVKAGLIGAIFMHLRFERLALVATVVVSTVFMLVALYFLISIDGQWIKLSAAH